METGLKVIDAMTSKPVSVTPLTSLRRCAELMKEKKVSSCLISEKSILLGIVTETMMTHEAVSMGYDVDDTTVKKIMTTDLVTITPDKDIFDAICKMRDYDVRRLPVLDYNNELIGLLTLSDILRIQPQLFEIIVDKIKIREEERKPINKDGMCDYCGEYSQNLYPHDNVYVCYNCLE